MPRNSYSIHWSYFRKYTQQNKLETLLLGHSKRLVPSYRVSLHRVLVPLTSICPLFIHFLFTLDTSLFRRIFDGLKYLKFYILINEIRFRIWTGTKILLPSQIIWLVLRMFLKFFRISFFWNNVVHITEVVCKLVHIKGSFKMTRKETVVKEKKQMRLPGVSKTVVLGQNTFC